MLAIIPFLFLFLSSFGYSSLASSLSILTVSSLPSVALSILFVPVFLASSLELVIGRIAIAPPHILARDIFATPILVLVLSVG